VWTPVPNAKNPNPSQAGLRKSAESLISKLDLRERKHMGYVPTHGSNCYRLRSYLTVCQSCGASVIFFECSCGSRVFLDPPYEGNHSCGTTKRKERAQLLLDLLAHAEEDPDGQMECPMCHVAIKNKVARRHFKKCPKRKVWFPLEA
jgi:hypothetical protein